MLSQNLINETMFFVVIVKDVITIPAVLIIYLVL